MDDIAPPDRSMTQSNGVNDTVANGKVVVLMASTGALGSYILNTLLESSLVSHIFCINRTVPKDSQVKRSQAHGLPLEFLDDCTTFLFADLSQEYLGLDPEPNTGIKESATDIIYTAWPANFNIPLFTFESNIKSVINLIEFAVSASHTPSLMFSLSLSLVGNFQGDVPQIIIDDITASLSMC